MCTAVQVAEEVSTEAPAKQNPVPPEVWQEIVRQVHQQSPARQEHTVRGYRVLLGLLAGVTVILGTIICRLVHRANVGGDEFAVFILFGLFGGLAGLLLAAACVGSLYLHVAAACCTTLSGFLIAGVLAPQSKRLRRWVLGDLETVVTGEHRDENASTPV